MTHTPLLIPQYAQSLRKPDYKNLTVTQIANAFRKLLYDRTSTRSYSIEAMMRYWSPGARQAFHKALAEEYRRLYPDALNLPVLAPSTAQD